MTHIRREKHSDTLLKTTPLYKFLNYIFTIS